MCVRDQNMINKPAPDFTITDLNGDVVSSQDLRGKIIVLDFWATWCMPCVKSLPGMQKAVNKFSSDDDVVFLFIDCWEKGVNVKQNVKNFLEQNNYTFQVIIDSKNNVVKKFKVNRIPTKFIIDKKGFIRHKSLGFKGDNQELVEELTRLIEQIK